MDFKIDWVGFSETYTSRRWRYPNCQPNPDAPWCKPPVLNGCLDGTPPCWIYSSWDDVPSGIEKNVLTHPTFTIANPWLINQIVDDHYNDGAGKDPATIAGTISIYRMLPGHEWDNDNSADELVGTYAASPENGSILHWVASPGIILPPGTYRIQDSDPDHLVVGKFPASIRSGGLSFVWAAGSDIRGSFQDLCGSSPYHDYAYVFAESVDAGDVCDLLRSSHFQRGRSAEWRNGHVHERHHDDGNGNYEWRLGQLYNLNTAAGCELDHGCVWRGYSLRPQHV